MDYVPKVESQVVDVARKAGAIEVLIIVGQQELHRVEEDRHVLKSLGEEGNRLQLLVEVLVVHIFVEGVGRLKNVEQGFFNGLDYTLFAAVVPALAQELVDELGG